MDAGMSIKDWIDLMHALGGPVAGVAVFLIYRASSVVTEALDTLKRIETAVVNGNVATDRADAHQSSKLDQIHEDVISMPLNILRATRK